MRHTILIFVLLFLPLFVQGQNDSVYKYWVSLADKQGSPYTLDNPSEYLGPRALERRAHQSIALDSLDLPVSPAYIQRLEVLGFRVQNRSKWLNGVVLFMADPAQAALLDTLPFVTSYDLFDYGTASLPEVLLEDGGNERLPALYDTAYSFLYYGAGLFQIDQLNGRSLHWAGYEGQGLIIGVCDGGFPGVDSIAFFDSLRNDGRLLATRDFVWDGGNVFSVHGHGTSVLSNLASYVPGLYVGTAPKASYVLCRTENTYSETPLEMYNWVAAAEYLDSLGADIISTSLGYYEYDDSTWFYPMDGHSAPMTLAAEIAVTRGMLVVNAAGNNGYYNPPYLNSPADGEHVLTVGAVDFMRHVTSFSSPGPTVDGRIKPDVMALGQSVLVSGTQGYLSTSNGTSFATPILAGMMACLWQRFPDWTPQQLCDSIRSWGDHVDSVDNYYGYGIPDFSRAFGYVPAPVAIDEVMPESSAFVVYPNPAHGLVTICLQAPIVGATLTVSDITGRKVCQYKVEASNSKFKIQSSQFPKGLYFLTLTTPSATSTQRLIVK